MRFPAVKNAADFLRAGCRTYGNSRTAIFLSPSKVRIRPSDPPAARKLLRTDRPKPRTTSSFRRTGPSEFTNEPGELTVGGVKTTNGVTISTNGQVKFTNETLEITNQPAKLTIFGTNQRTARRFQRTGGFRRGFSQNPGRFRICLQSRPRPDKPFWPAQPPAGGTHNPGNARLRRPPPRGAGTGNNNH